MATKSVSIKLLIDKKSGKVLFGEAGKDFVDFLFHILSLPVDTVVNLLSKGNMVGSLGKLYDSIESLDETYMQVDLDKGGILNPKMPSPTANIPLLKCNNEVSSGRQVLYNCNGVNSCTACRSNVADNPNAICPSCRNCMNRRMTYIAAAPADQVETNISEGGYVKAVITYMVMDDLTLKPMSTISSITLLNSFSVTDLGALQEKAVTLGKNEIPSYYLLRLTWYTIHIGCEAAENVSALG
ncbi:hypothetical protein RJ640_030679 [Escallonia rubra]|uniref:Uncharacterized protein n=1 Tax=Escallonia rubra TaxID=112253 RepID=A0AA88RLE0_9ASTE|nr:hypothetical protein RJ640_030679 [Escallonia rubra]